MLKKLDKQTITVMILILTALLISGYCDALTCNQTGELKQLFEDLFSCYISTD